MWTVRRRWAWPPRRWPTPYTRGRSGRCRSSGPTGHRYTCRRCARPWPRPVSGPPRADYGCADSLPAMADEDKKPEPVDDLVTTAHTLPVGDRDEAYPPTTGPIVARHERPTDDRFAGPHPHPARFL